MTSQPLYREAVIVNAFMHRPTITSLVPATAVVGGADLTLQVNGTNFTEDTYILFNNGREPTTFVSATKVTTGVKPSLVGAPIVVPVTVNTPGSAESNSKTFTFTATGMQAVSASNTKAEVQDYLDEQGIEYPSDATKADLLELAQG